MFEKKIAQTNLVIKLNQFSGQIWKIEGTKLVNKAGMFFSNDDWNLIPVSQGKNLNIIKNFNLVIMIKLYKIVLH